MQTEEERWDEILEAYRSVLLSENLVYMLRGHNETISNENERLAFSNIANKAAELTLELGILVKKLADTLGIGGLVVVRIHIGSSIDFVGIV